MQIKRKNIIICSMILLLFVVGYTYNTFTTTRFTDTAFNLDFSGQDEPSAALEKADQQDQVAENNEITEMNNDVQIVQERDEKAIEASGSSFFSEYRLERDKNRSKEVEMWQDIINNDTAEETFKNMAQQELVKIVALTEKEMIIENLIIARGFNDALVFLADDSATIIVDAKELTPANVAQIQDIVVRKTKLDPSNIKIMKKN